MDKAQLSSTRSKALEICKNMKPLKMGASEFKFEHEPLSPEFVEKARNELRETDENVKNALEEIRRLMKDETDLHVPDDDLFYAKFLRPCKWHPKPAFELIKRFYQYRIDHPRYCNNLYPSTGRDIFVSGVITPLPVRTKEGCRIVLIESGKRWKPKEISLDQIFRGVMLLLDAAILEPTTQVGGVRVILDMDGLSISQVTYFTPSFARAVLEWVQKCLPVRLKGVHIINQPFIFNMVFAIFKPFLMEKLRNRVHFHGTNRAELLSYVDPKAIPTRYGGELDIPLEPIGETLWEYLCKFEEPFQEADTFGYKKLNKNKH